MFLIGIKLKLKLINYILRKLFYCILKNIAKARTKSLEINSASINFQYSRQRYRVRNENKLPKINTPMKLNA